MSPLMRCLPMMSALSVGQQLLGDATTQVSPSFRTKRCVKICSLEDPQEILTHSRLLVSRRDGGTFEAVTAATYYFYVKNEE